MTSWFRDAKPSEDILPISRFLDGEVFATPAGLYGLCFRLAGVDPECLADSKLSNISSRLAAALSCLPEGATLMQYVVRRRECELPHLQDNARIDFLTETAHLGSIELYWVLCVQPSALKPKERSKETARRIRDLRKASVMLREQIADIVMLTPMNEYETAHFFSYLLTLEEYLTIDHLRSRQNVSQQIAVAPIEWHDDYLRIGHRYAQPFSLIRAPKGTRPDLFGALRAIDCDLILCSRWTARTTEQTRKEASLQEGFIGMFKHSVMTVAVHMGAKKELPRDARSIASEKGIETIAGILDDIENEGAQYGHYSLYGLAHSRELSEVQDALPQIHRIFQDPAEAKILEEGIGAMSAYYALFPGNERFIVGSRKPWLKDSHNANLLFAYQPNVGHLQSEALEDEYLTIYETRDRTPFFFDPYFNGLRGLLITGAPGSGKSINGNHIVASEQKYGGYTYIFDIGRSYENTVLAHDGMITSVGLDGPRINPFSLEPTDDNLIFLFRFVRLLLEKSGVDLNVDEENDLAAKVKQMYALSPTVRRLKYLANLLPKHVSRGLSKWIDGGVYGRIFDNETDSLELARLQCFDFQDVGEDHQDLLEPVLFWIIRRTNAVIHDPKNLGVPKHLLFDEVFKQLKNPQLLEMLLMSLKTGRKHLAGVTLLTHLVQDLGEHAALIKNACPMAMFLGDPTFDREQYRTFFDLNDTELDLIGSLKPHELLLKRSDFAKVLILNLDAKSFALYTTRAKDRMRRKVLTDAHGFEKGIELFAAANSGN